MSHLTPLRMALIALFIGLVSLSIAYAEQLPEPGAADPRIRHARYDPHQVYRVTGRVGYQLTLAFASGESFVGLAAGDSEALTFEAQDRWLFIKPRATRVATNLTILTNRRQYFLDYRVEPTRILPDGSTRSEPTFYALQFEYPEEESRAAATLTAALAQNDRINVALAAPPKVVNSRYRYCGPRSLKPTTVTDDGVRTRFTFAPTAELPAIFTAADDGTESVLNFTVTEDALLVHRIAKRFILRRGKLVACVVNDGFTGGAGRLTTGTVSSAVARESVSSAPVQP